MLNWLNLLLLLFLANHMVNDCGGATTVYVSGKQGGSAILNCDCEARDIFHIRLNSRSKNIPICKTEECSGRIFKQGNCDVFIKDLSFTDAGKYILKISYYDDQAEMNQHIRMYQLQIHDEIHVKAGELLKLDALLANADKLQHQSRRSTAWMEDWSRTDGVQSERITIGDGNFIINPFTARDAGTYRILDSEGQILITVTLTESKYPSTESEKKTDKADNKVRFKVPVINLIMSALLCLYQVLLVAALVTLVKSRNTNF